jgi:hypothetical protein
MNMNQRSRRNHLRIGVIALLTGLVLHVPAGAYPLDGYESTGIARLLYQRKIQEGQLKGSKRKRPTC